MAMAMNSRRFLPSYCRGHVRFAHTIQTSFVADKMPAVASDLTDALPNVIHEASSSTLDINAFNVISESTSAAAWLGQYSPTRALFLNAHHYLHVPPFTALCALGLLTPLLTHRLRSKDINRQNMYAEHNEDIQQFNRVYSYVSAQGSDGTARAKYNEFLKKYQSKNLPQSKMVLTHGLEFMIPMALNSSVNTFFNKCNSQSALVQEHLLESDAVREFMQLATQDTTWFLALPLAYATLKVYHNTHKLTSIMGPIEQRVPAAITALTGLSYIAFMPGSQTVAGTMFLTVYALSHAIVGVAHESSFVARKFGWPVKKKYAFSQRGYQTGMSRWQSWVSSWKALSFSEKAI